MKCHDQMTNALNINQPALIEQLKFLERQLGAHLFNRSGNKLRLVNQVACVNRQNVFYAKLIFP